MLMGIVGEPQSGKSSLLELMRRGEGARRGAHDHEVVTPVPDARLDWLSAQHSPKKVTPATLEFTDLGADARHAGLDLSGLLAAADLRLCDGLVLVLGLFATGGEGAVDELASFELATAVADLDLVERRLERLAADRARGRKEGEAEVPLLERMRDHLEAEQPLRTAALSEGEAAQLRGYQFLSLKPVVVVANVGEDAVAAGAPEALVDRCGEAQHALCVLSAPIEAEIAALDAEERADFMGELGIEQPAVDRFLQAAYAGLGLISFLTAGPDECRAWSVPQGATAPQAAGRIHTDLQRGFIRAEVVSFEDLKSHADKKAAKAAGVVRLEGKDYVVQDGDVVEIRFSV